MRDLLTLYKLLWEQIKDKEVVQITKETERLRSLKIITKKEEVFLDHDFHSNWKRTDKKHFVQSRIKELT